MRASQSAVVFHVLTQPSSAECNSSLQGTIFYQLNQIQCDFFSLYNATLEYTDMSHYYIITLLVQVQTHAARVPLAFQHLKGLSVETMTAKNVSFNAVNIDHSLYLFSCFLIVSSGL